MLSRLRSLALLSVVCPAFIVPGAAQQGGRVEPRSVVQELRATFKIDCSAYRREADGGWTVLRSNTILLEGRIGREVIPEDDPQTAKLTDGTRLETALNRSCGR